MEIMKLISAKAENLKENKNPTLVFLGDSVTQGCFEAYMTSETDFTSRVRTDCVYHSYLAKILALLYPRATVNIINAGIGGENAAQGLARLERDVLAWHPDLTVVAFGLNNVWDGLDGVEAYAQTLTQIFERLKQAGSEVIYMTNNMMNTRLSYPLPSCALKDIAERAMKLQNDGVLDAYFEAGKKVAAQADVSVCDVYSKWKKMAANGVDTTALLANHINHPCQELHRLVAYSLIETMMES